MSGSDDDDVVPETSAASVPSCVSTLRDPNPLVKIKHEDTPVSLEIELDAIYEGLMTADRALADTDWTSARTSSASAGTEPAVAGTESAVAEPSFSDTEPPGMHGILCGNCGGNERMLASAAYAV